MIEIFIPSFDQRGMMRFHGDSRAAESDVSKMIEIHNHNIDQRGMMRFHTNSRRYKIMLVACSIHITMINCYPLLLIHSDNALLVQATRYDARRWDARSRNRT